VVAKVPVTVTDQDVTVRAWRAFARVRFVGLNGLLVGFQAFVDPGAPFSVIPYSLWHGRRIRWTALGTHLMRAGRPATEGMLWQGVPCDLGTSRRQRHPARARRSRAGNNRLPPPSRELSRWHFDVEADSVDRLSSVRPSIGAGDSGTNIGRSVGDSVPLPP
jgi:hypothetical protein